MNYVCEDFLEFYDNSMKRTISTDREIVEECYTNNHYEVSIVEEGVANTAKKIGSAIWISIKNMIQSLIEGLQKVIITIQTTKKTVQLSKLKANDCNRLVALFAITESKLPKLNDLEQAASYNPESVNSLLDKVIETKQYSRFIKRENIPDDYDKSDNATIYHLDNVGRSAKLCLSKSNFLKKWAEVAEKLGNDAQQKAAPFIKALVRFYQHFFTILSRILSCPSALSKKPI